MTLRSTTLGASGGQTIEVVLSTCVPDGSGYGPCECAAPGTGGAGSGGAMGSGGVVGAGGAASTTSCQVLLKPWSTMTSDVVLTWTVLPNGMPTLTMKEQWPAGVLEKTGNPGTSPFHATYDKVRRERDAERARVVAAIGDYTTSPPELSELQERLRRLDAVDMAVVVSPGQNEIEDMRKRGLDIVPHRERMVRSQPGLDEKFKDPDDALSLVFVCAMWLTGFDAPSCSTVYLDKPMRNHTLMQTIARANRVYPGKHSGVIVDYANVFESLEKALAIYGTAGSARSPVRDKDVLVGELRKTISDLEAFCAAGGVQLATIEASATATERLTRVGEAADALLAPDERRKGWSASARSSTNRSKASPWSPRHRVEGELARFCLGEGSKRGDITGPNPTDRAKSGVKRHILTDGRGVPIGALISALPSRPRLPISCEPWAPPRPAAPVSATFLRSMACAA